MAGQGLIQRPLVIAEILPQFAALPQCIAADPQTFMAARQSALILFMPALDDLIELEFRA